MDDLAVTAGRKADSALGKTQRLRKILQDYLRHHRIEGSTEATVRFYAKELRLYLEDLEKPPPIVRP